MDNQLVSKKKEKETAYTQSYVRLLKLHSIFGEMDSEKKQHQQKPQQKSLIHVI